jgi:hypothetical protein
VSCRLPAPDLIRGLPMTHEAPDQVRGGVSAKVKTILTEKSKPLQIKGYSNMSTVDTP